MSLIALKAVLKKSGYNPSTAILDKAEELSVPENTIFSLCVQAVKRFEDHRAIYSFDDSKQKAIRLKNDDGSFMTLENARDKWVLEQFEAGARIVCADCSTPTPYQNAGTFHGRSEKAVLCGRCAKPYLEKEETARIENEKREEQYRKEYEYKSRLHDSGLRKRHTQMTFDNWTGMHYPEIRDYQPDCSKNIFLHGSVGSGKTHQIVALLHRLMQAEKDVSFIGAIELLSKIKASFNHGDTALSTEQIVDRFSTDSFLAIDDLGSERGSEWVTETFYLILNRRYEGLLPTFVTSNLNPTELASKLGDRIISRLLGHGTIIKELKSEDYRLITGSARRKDE